jgi:hypothetical protein
MLETVLPAALGRGRRAGKSVGVRTPITFEGRPSRAARQALLDTLKAEHARLNGRLGVLALADLDDRAEAREIREVAGHRIRNFRPWLGAVIFG